jgi:tetratricopeptide (TPR) repeat protein
MKLSTNPRKTLTELMGSRTTPDPGLKGPGAPRPVRFAPFALVWILLAIPALGQNPDGDRFVTALRDRALGVQVAGLNTDQRIQTYQKLAQSQPGEPHYLNLLAATYIQKVRETTDFSYLDRAGQILESVLSKDKDNYEALRLNTEVELERHDFKGAVESSRHLTNDAPNDAWNWGTLGDALIEEGQYEAAADAYQRMMDIKPDLSSYNRAAYFRFLYGDMSGAIDIMKQAIVAGSPIPENVAWCMVELGHFYLKSGRLDEAEHAYSAALRPFSNYHPALAGLGHVAKLRGQTQRAIELYKSAQARTPLPDYAGALHDLYLAAGEPKEALKQMQLVDVIDRLGQAAKERVNRNLAMIYANHDYKIARALELAKTELEVRNDIYTWDTLAWALLKNGKAAEADAAIKRALVLGTPEPMFYMHAAKIAGALGHSEDAAKYRKQTLAFDPSFNENSL